MAEEHGSFRQTRSDLRRTRPRAPVSATPNPLIPPPRRIIPEAPKPPAPIARSNRDAASPVLAKLRRAGGINLPTANAVAFSAQRQSENAYQEGLGGQDAFESVEKAVGGDHYDDILISTLPKRRSEWLRKDLPTRVESLGLPVMVITPPEEPSPLQSFTEQFSARAT